MRKERPTSAVRVFEPEISRCSHPLPLHLDSVSAQVVFLTLERSYELVSAPGISAVAGVEFYRILQGPSGKTSIDVKLENETVWLSKEQMAVLFERDRTVISRHIKKIYEEGELIQDITCAKFAHMGSDEDQTYITELYNLDVPFQ